MENENENEKEKSERIEKFVFQKQNSMREMSIRRDAALFTAYRLGTWKEVIQKNFIEEHEFWMKFFTKKYQ